MDVSYPVVKIVSYLAFIASIKDLQLHYNDKNERTLFRVKLHSVTETGKLFSGYSSHVRASIVASLHVCDSCRLFFKTEWMQASKISLKSLARKDHLCISL